MNVIGGFELVKFSENGLVYELFINLDPDT